MRKDDYIANTLIAVKDDILRGNNESAIQRLNSIAEKQPDWIDGRFAAELSLIESYMHEISENKEWHHLRTLKTIYRYLELNYSPVVVAVRDISEDEIGKPLALLPEKDTVWICWLQGMDKAPEIVKACYRSLNRLSRRVIVLNNKNLKDYIRMPDHILDKYERGIIDNTHYSDLIRAELLTTLGGTWIDATAYITDHSRLEEILDEEDYFAFHAGNVSDYILYDSWLMHFKKKSHIINTTRNMLYEYWKNENDKKHYFLFHLFFTIACKKYHDEMLHFPLYSNEPAHVLQNELLDTYNDRRWKQIMNMSFIHKLTYKYDNTIDIADTNLQILLNGGFYEEAGY